MNTTCQIIDLFPIASFLIKLNSFEIVYFNRKGLRLSQLNESALKKRKFYSFVNKDLLQVGEFENCKFEINADTCLIGTLTVQSFDTDYLIVSFCCHNKSNDSRSTVVLNEAINKKFEVIKSLLDLSTDSIFIIQNGIIKYVNPTLLVVSGYKKGELLGLHFSEFVSEVEREKVESLFFSRNKGGVVPSKYESKAKLRNGEYIDVDVSVETVSYDKMPAFQVVLRDITKQKMAEKKYRNIIDFAPIGFYQTSRNGDFLLVNNEMANILGFAHVEELISRNISEFYYSNDEREQLIRKYDTTTKSDVKNIEIKFKKKDGSPVWILMTSTAIKDARLKTISYDGFIMDISIRKRRERIQALLLNLSKKSFLNIGLKEYLELIHNELKQIMKAENFYVALYDKDTDKYTFPYSVDPYDEEDYNSPVSLPHSLTNYVRESKQGRMVVKNTMLELNRKRQLEVYGEVSAVWLGVPLIDSSNDEALGVMALQDYDDENAYDDEDFNTVKIVAGNLGLFIERILNQERLKLAKVVAEEGEKRYKSLFYENNSVMILIDPDSGAIVDANNSACDYYGYSYRQLTAINIQSINILAEDEVKAEMKRALNSQRQYFNFKHKLSSGEVRDVEVYSGSVTISGKDLLYSIVHDVTERKLAEDKVLKLSTSIDQSPISIVITDLAGVIEYVNPYYCELTGYEVGELVGKNQNILKSGLHDKLFYKGLWDSILAGNKFRGEICNRKKNGDLFWELANISPIINREGEITNFVGIKEDITKKREIEKKLKFLADSLEQVGECVSITDENDVILYVNTAFCVTYGYTKRELLGNHVSILQPVGFVQNELNDLLIETKKGNWKGELINKRKDGTLFPIFLSTSVIIDHNNNQLAFIGISIDVTKMKETNNELIAAKEKAEESDRLKTAFLANMSHEIRTPMNGILGFTELLLEPDLSEETKEEFVQIIHQSGERMLNTVNDIIEISKIEAGIVVVNNSLFNVTDSVNSIISFFQPQAERKGLVLIYERKIQESNLTIVSDKSKYESILTNLIKNAIKYTDNGTITVSSYLCNDFIEFCVNDTGIGIPSHRVSAVFKRFEQADISDTRAFEGSGLGLTIAKSYVEMLGGKIWVESVEGAGSQFYFRIPNRPGEIDSAPTCNTKAPDNQLNLQRQLRFLIVEDDEASAIYLETILDGIAVKMIHVRTGEQAIDACLATDDFDVVLMDIKMPGIDGFEATRRIREFNKEVIIIAQTAYAMSVDKEKAISAGCNDYIAKPIRKKDLVDKIANWIS